MVKELQRKQRLKRLVYSWPSLVLLAIFSVLLVRGAVEIFGKERESAKVVAELEERTMSLAAREAYLQGEIKSLNTKEGIIEEIKRKFSATREGEYVAILVEEKGGDISTSTTTGEWLRGAWQNFKNLWSN